MALLATPLWLVANSTVNPAKNRTNPSCSETTDATAEIVL